jgi:hypothetical protein
MGNIQGSSPVDPQAIAKYQEQYKHGVDLFQRALDEYQQAEEVHKKDAFRKVMDKALQALNDTARGMRRQDLLEKNSQIKEDFLVFQKAPSHEAKSQLESDLKNAEKAL